MRKIDPADCVGEAHLRLQLASESRVDKIFRRRLRQSFADFERGAGIEGTAHSSLPSAPTG